MPANWNWDEEALGRRSAGYAGTLLIVDPDGSGWLWLVGCVECRTVHENGIADDPETAMRCAEAAADEWAARPDGFV
jgi:hypothetical protein